MRKIKKHNVLLLCILLGISVLVRIDYHSWQGLIFMPDTGSYLNCADNILIKGQILDPHRTPVYPIFLILNYILFGYREFVPVAIVQSLLGIASVFLVYCITFRLTRNQIISFMAGLLISFNYHILRYETFIVTESLSAFLVVLTIYVLLIALEKGFRLRYAIICNICYLTLVFLKPIFVVELIVIPLVGVIYFLKEKDKKALINLLVSFFIIVIIPIGLWCFAIKRHYGFFGISNVSQYDLWGVVLQRGVHKFAPPEYKEFTEAIERERSKLGTKERNDPVVVKRALAKVIPQKSRADYTYLMRYSIACIKNAPFFFLRQTLPKLPEVFSKMKKARKFKKTRTLVSRIGERLYRSTVYNLFGSRLWFVVIFFSIFCLATVYRKSFLQWLGILIILLFIWFHVVTLLIFAPQAYGRLRMPVDSLIIITVCAGLYYLITILKRDDIKKMFNLFRQKKV